MTDSEGGVNGLGFTPVDGTVKTGCPRNGQLANKAAFRYNVEILVRTIQ